MSITISGENLANSPTEIGDTQARAAGVQADASKAKASPTDALQKQAKVRGATDAAHIPAEPVKPKGDTAKISVAAKARLLKKQGHSVKEIASQLRVDVKTVNTFFK